MCMFDVSFSNMFFLDLYSYTGGLFVKLHKRITKSDWTNISWYPPIRCLVRLAKFREPGFDIMFIQ